MISDERARQSAVAIDMVGAALRGTGHDDELAALEILTIFERGVQSSPDPKVARERIITALTFILAGFMRDHIVAQGVPPEEAAANLQHIGQLIARGGQH